MSIRQLPWSLIWLRLSKRCSLLLSCNGQRGSGFRKESEEVFVCILRIIEVLGMEIHSWHPDHRDGHATRVKVVGLAAADREAGCDDKSSKFTLREG